METLPNFWGPDAVTFADFPPGGDGKYQTNILLSKFKVVNGEWTFQTKKGYWLQLPNDPVRFIGNLIHFAQKEDTTKNDIMVLLDWAVDHYGWDVHGTGSNTHTPYSLNQAKQNPKNYSSAKSAE